MICHNVNHWWLMRCDFEDKTILSYDSGLNRKIKDPKIKDEHVNLLKKLFHQKYGTNLSWSITNVPVPQQPGSDQCGPLTLMYLEHVLHGADFDLIDPNATSQYRHMIAEKLLLTSPNGNKLLTQNGIEVKMLLGKISGRDIYRKTEEPVGTETKKMYQLFEDVLRTDSHNRLQQIESSPQFSIMD